MFRALHRNHAVICPQNSISKTRQYFSKHFFKLAKRLVEFLTSCLKVRGKGKSGPFFSVFPCTGQNNNGKREKNAMRDAATQMQTN